MARVNLSVIELTDRGVCSAAVANANIFTAVDATAGADFAMADRDEKYLIAVQNVASAAKTVTVKAGNGFQAGEDLVCEVPATSTVTLSLDSGRYKQVSGEDKGKVVILGADANIKVAVFKLP